MAAPIVQAAPLVADPGVAEQYDVELIDLSVAPPPLKGWRLSKRDILMVAIGGIVTTVFLMMCAGASLAINSWFRRE